VNTAFNWPCKVISYNKNKRSAQVQIAGMTDGSEKGLTATLAYPIGDDDRDTERRLLDELPNADGWVFFEGGNQKKPVLFAYRSHGTGALVDIRNIRQKHINLIADETITLTAGQKITLNVADSKMEIESGIIKFSTSLMAFETDLATFSALVNVLGLLSANGGLAAFGVGGGTGATIQGGVTVSGGDVTADDISLKNHKTPYTDNGNSMLSGEPVP
jgi:hypothetical protein